MKHNSDTMTLEYMMEIGGSMVWPQATKMTFLVKSIFMSNAMWQGIHLDPTSAVLPLSRISNAGVTRSIFKIGCFAKKKKQWLF